MINDDTLIKIVRSRGYKKTWPDQVNRMKARLTWIKLGFPGIRNDHLTISLAKDLKEGDLYIYDQYLEKGFGYGDEAPLMLKWINPEQTEIVGIGQGEDSRRDPTRKLLRWKDIIPAPQLDPDTLVLSVNPSPTLNGGSAYYYFFKSYRDLRS
jgi:hypothetical protein